MSKANHASMPLALRASRRTPARRLKRDEGQAWFFSEEVQARIAEAEADFACGRSYTTNSPEEAQRLLDSWKR